MITAREELKPLELSKFKLNQGGTDFLDSGNSWS